MRARLLRELRIKAMMSYAIRANIEPPFGWEVRKYSRGHWHVVASADNLNDIRASYRNIVRADITARLWERRYWRSIQGQLLIALIAFVLLLIFTSCSAPKVATHIREVHDTITIERVMTEQITHHDTITIKDNSEREEVRVVLDTLERVREVVHTKWLTKVVTEAGNTSEAKTDEAVKASSSSHSSELQREHTESFPSSWGRIIGWGCTAYAVVVSIILLILKILNKNGRE